jgi:transposase
LPLAHLRIYDIEYFTLMPPHAPADPKFTALRARGAANPTPEAVTDELFSSGDFFDRRDLVQVKYEMLRRVRFDGWSVTRAATAFGFSRPTFYAAQEAFMREGLPGLMPQKRGPRHPRKLTDEVVDFVQDVRSTGGVLDAVELASRVEERFGFRVHPRSIERALARVEKKHP